MLSKRVIVTFQRTIIVEETEGKSEEEIRAMALDMWNHDLRDEEIQMKNEHIIDVETDI